MAAFALRLLRRVTLTGAGSHAPQTYQKQIPYCRNCFSDSTNRRRDIFSGTRRRRPLSSDDRKLSDDRDFDEGQTKSEDFEEYILKPSINAKHRITWPSKFPDSKQTKKNKDVYKRDEFVKEDRSHFSPTKVSDALLPIKRTKEYNYGLSGLGKTMPEKLMARPETKGEIIYGIHSILLAITANRRQFHKVFMRDRLIGSDRPIIKQLVSAAREKGIEVEECSKSHLDSLSQARPHQGVCLDASRLEYETLMKWVQLFLNLD